MKKKKKMKGKVIQVARKENKYDKVLKIKQKKENEKKKYSK